MGGCWNRCASCVFFLVILAAAVIATGYFYALPRLDTLLADSLRRELMLAPSSEVKIVRGNLLDTMQGRIERVLINSQEAKLDGLVVEDLRFVAEGVHFDLTQTLATQQAKFQDVSSGHISLRISEQAMANYWETELKPSGLSKIQVELKNNKAKITGLYHVLVTDIRLGASGNFKVDGTDRVRFQATEFDLGGVSINVEQLKAVFSKLTPVINLGQFKMLIVVDELRPSDGYLYIVARSQSLEEKMQTEEQKQLKEKQQAKQPAAEAPATAEPPAANDSPKGSSK